MAPSDESQGRDWVLKESLLKVMFKLGVPIAVGQSLNLIYNLTDMFWLGRVGTEGLAAVSASWPVVWLIIAGSLGILQAGIALVSQYWGAKDWENAMSAAGQVMFTVLAVGGPAAVISYFGVPPLLSVLGVPPDVLGAAATYSKIFSIGILFMGIGEGVGAIFSAAGDTVTPMKIRAFGNVMNMFLDPLLILGYFGFPALGVMGAATATVLSEASAAALALLILSRGVKGEKLKLKHLRPKLRLLKKLVRVGAPLSILSLGEAAGFTLLVSIISMTGSAALAAWGVGDRPMGLFHVFVSGLLGASATIIGQSLGAGLVDRAKHAARMASLYGAGIMAIGIGVLIPLRYNIATFFAPSDPLVIEYAADFVLIMGPSVIFFTLYLAANAVGQGSGRTKPVMLIGLFRLWVLRNVLAYLFGPGPLGMGAPGLWLGMAVSNFITGSIALVWILKGSWAKPIIKEDAAT